MFRRANARRLRRRAGNPTRKYPERKKACHCWQAFLIWCAREGERETAKHVSPRERPQAPPKGRQSNHKISRKKKGLSLLTGLFNMVHSGGFEPPTARFVAEYSIQLSYECVVWRRVY